MVTDDFFRARLDSMIDMRHPLVVRERPAVPHELTTPRRRRSRRPAVRQLVSASGAATALRCGCWGGWAAAPAHRAGRPKDRAGGAWPTAPGS